MKIATESLHLILTEQLYKIDQIDKISPNGEPKLLETSQCHELHPLANQDSYTYPGLQVITEPLTNTSNDTLNKLLKAIGRDVNTTSIIKSWDKTINFEKTIIFGFTDSETKLNELQDKGKNQILHTYNISYLDSHKEAKIELWRVLKAWFNA